MLNVKNSKRNPRLPFLEKKSASESMTHGELGGHRRARRPQHPSRQRSLNGDFFDDELSSEPLVL